ncbi:MAG TPA: hypothetical protein VMH87_06010, partial [Pseudomonadales bacterium]|nr:hypothetical protein [Pseudomonadales bacterium]
MNVNLTPLVPMLWVIPPDVIKDIHPEFLASLLSQLEGTKVWEFEGGGFAFSIAEVLVKRGIP